jgi:BON domain
MKARVPLVSRVARGRTAHGWLEGVALILLLLAGSYGCSIRDPWQDARIDSEVKARLVAEKNANLTRLGVVSREAVVYLSGTVTSADEKALAETVAKSVGGVRRVVSTLEVRSPAAE